MDTQAKFERELGRRAESQKCELVVDRSGAHNVGIYRIQEEGEFAPIIEFGFSWQGGRASFDGVSLNYAHLSDSIGNAVDVTENQHGHWTRVEGGMFDVVLRRISAFIINTLQEREDARKEELVKQLTS